MSWAPPLRTVALRVRKEWMACFLPLSKKLAYYKGGPVWWCVTLSPEFGRGNLHEMSQGKCWQNLSIQILPLIICVGSIMVRWRRRVSRDWRAIVAVVWTWGDLFWRSFCLSQVTLVWTARVTWTKSCSRVEPVSSFLSFKKGTREEGDLGQDSSTVQMTKLPTLTHTGGWERGWHHFCWGCPSWLVYHVPLSCMMTELPSWAFPGCREPPSFWLSSVFQWLQS